VESEKGSALVAVLVGFLVISLVLLNMLEIAGMDRKMSINTTALLQARQAVDGGIAWACEQTYNNLLDSGTQVLPDVPVGASLAPVTIGSGSNEASYQIVGDGVELDYQGSNYCIYKFGCEGSCRGATQNALVKVKYRFISHYHYVAGKPVLDGRTFMDHGKIESYQPLNPASSL